jgi:hypothetical protein
LGRRPVGPRVPNAAVPSACQRACNGWPAGARRPVPRATSGWVRAPGRTARRPAPDGPAARPAGGRPAGGRPVLGLAACGGWSTWPGTLSHQPPTLTPKPKNEIRLVVEVGRLELPCLVIRAHRPHPAPMAESGY